MRNKSNQIHVDDGIMFVEDKSQIGKVLNGLQKSFEISKTENPTIYLVMEIKISTEGIWISQENYAKRYFRNLTCKIAKTVQHH
jgi:hypothetical protein